MARKMLNDGELSQPNQEEQTHFDFDLFVIGAGSGGVRAARFSANFGAKVYVVMRFKSVKVNICCYLWTWIEKKTHLCYLFCFRNLFNWYYEECLDSCIYENLNYADVW